MLFSILSGIVVNSHFQTFCEKTLIFLYWWCHRKSLLLPWIMKSFKLRLHLKVRISQKGWGLQTLDRLELLIVEQIVIRTITNWRDLGVFHLLDSFYIYKIFIKISLYLSFHEGWLRERRYYFDTNCFCTSFLNCYI